MKIVIISLFLFLLLGCSSGDCISCTDGITEQVICEDDGINYTDQNDNIITWEEAAHLHRSQKLSYG